MSKSGGIIHMISVRAANVTSPKGERSASILSGEEMMRLISDAMVIPASPSAAGDHDMVKSDCLSP